MSLTILPTRSGSRVVLAVVTAAAVAAGGSVAYAAWTSSATGSSQAKSATASSATVTAAAGTAGLYPGASDAVYFTVTNPNSFAVTYTTATFGAVVSSDEATCPAANVTTTDKTGLNITVAANTTSATLSIPTAVSMAANAPDGCQNKTFTITTTLGA